MTSNKNAADHLSDEQFCELLMGGADHDSHAEADALKGALHSYQRETLLWAERRSASMPSLALAERQRTFWSAVPQWTLAAVAVMTVAVGVIHFSNSPQEAVAMGSPAAITQTTREGSTTSQQIADDNALLTSIDAAVNADSSLPVADLGLDLPRATDRPHGSMD